MLLSRLAYNCVNRAVGNDGHSMSYAEFTQGKAEADPYLSGAFSRVFPEINAFLARLSTLEKIAARTASVTTESGDESPLIPLSDMIKEAGVDGSSVSQIISAFQEDGGRHRLLAWRLDGSAVRILSRFREGKPILIQFRVVPPQFTEDDIEPIAYDESSGKWLDADGNAYATKALADRNVDLSSYGVSDEACALCLDWFDAKYNRDVDPQAANALMIQTESRLSGLRPLETPIVQTRVERALR